MLRKELWNIAVDQYGFVTTADARALGAAPGELARLHRRGMLEKARHGIYRFAELPVTARDEYMLAALWTNTPEAALSHDTALAVYELCQVNPDRIHVTVPTGHRVKRAGGELYILHRQNLLPNQLGWWEGIRAVTEYTAIEQGINTDVPVHLLTEAIDTARKLGRITTGQETALQQRMDTRYAA